MFIAIDGASRRNGKPDCISAGGAFIMESDRNGGVRYETLSIVEEESTNQRGEIMALVLALRRFTESEDDSCFILTDSEYIFRCVRNDWTVRWRHNGYITSTGEPVKNRDLWETVDKLLSEIDASYKELLIYHIKGHTIALKPKRVLSLYEEDGTCEKLLHAFEERFDERIATLESDEATFKVAQELSKANNGFTLTPHNLKNFVCCNAVADAIATIEVDRVNKISN